MRRRLAIAIGPIVLLTACSRSRPVLVSTPAARTVKHAADPPPGDTAATRTIEQFFQDLSAGQEAAAQADLCPSLRERLGPAGIAGLLHEIQSARVTKLEDAVAWARRLGANLGSPPADRREYLVTVDVAPSTPGPQGWTPGLNRRFIDLVRTPRGRTIDEISRLPGVLVTGRPGGSTPIVLRTAPPPSPTVATGLIPIDRPSLIALQKQADASRAPWATDPVKTLQHDAPRVGLSPQDSMTLVRRSKDAIATGDAAIIRVTRDGTVYDVRLTQPIKAGPSGVWAIAEVQSGQEPEPTASP